jgi:hypothetical protein
MKLPILISKLIAVVGRLVQWNWNVEQGKQGFIFSILWCSYTSYHPLEDLAKFGYGSKRKVKTFIMFWVTPTQTYCPNMTVLKKKTQNLVTSLGLIFSTKILCMSCILCMISPKTWTLEGSIEQYDLMLVNEWWSNVNHGKIRFTWTNPIKNLQPQCYIVKNCIPHVKH